MNTRQSEPQTGNWTRRTFAQSLALGGVMLPALARPHALIGGSPAKRPRVAAIFTVFHFRSHAYNILENFLGAYYLNGTLQNPAVDIVSFYADQFSDGDMTLQASERFGIPLYDTVGAALRCGGSELAVDGVLCIGEHGIYPYDKLGRHMYPRKRLFDESVAVMKASDRYVPYFNDKHLSYRWDEAKEMYDTARANQIPLMAGSSVPLAQRIPPLNLPPEADIEEAVSIHGGGLESYDFHALEILQSIVESRRGGETGITDVELLTGERFQQAQREGRWSADLAAAALQAENAMNVERQPFPQVPRKPIGDRRQPRPIKSSPDPRRPSGDYAISLRYRDGLKATVLRLGSDGNRWNFACRLRGDKQPHATAFFNGPWGNRGLFQALSHSIQQLFVTRREPYPVERTLLTTGVVDAVMHAYDTGQPIRTQHLELAYQTPRWSHLREGGATWKTVTVDTPQPTRFAPRPLVR